MMKGWRLRRSKGEKMICSGGWPGGWGLPAPKREMMMMMLVTVVMVMAVGLRLEAEGTYRVECGGGSRSCMSQWQDNFDVMPPSH